LAPGSYQLQFSGTGFVTSWYKSAASQGSSTAIVLSAGQALTASDSVVPVATLSGKVTDSSSGSGLSGATVTVYPAGSGTAAATLSTAGDGSFSTTSLAPGSYQVLVAAAGHTSAWYLNASSQSSSTTVVLTAGSTSTVNQALVVPVTTGTISGTLTNSVTSAGASGVTVNAYLNGSGTVGSSVVTGSGGSFSLSSLAPGSWQLQFTGAGFVTSWYKSAASQGSSTAIALVAGQTATANDQVVPVATLNGKVTDSSTGAGISGATVTVYPVGSSTAAATLTTASDGTWSTTSISAGSYQALIAASGYTSAWYSNATSQSGSTTIVLTAGATTTANQALAATVQAGVATITGTVTDATTGNPVKSTNVRIWVVGGSNFLVSAVTNTSGQYTISNLAPGTYQIQFANTAYNTLWYPNSTSRGPTVTVVANQTLVANAAIVSKTAPSVVTDSRSALLRAV
jgi:protocatechuate 3,4-dioxygenase beta subunit